MAQMLNFVQARISDIFVPDLIFSMRSVLNTHLGSKFGGGGGAFILSSSIRHDRRWLLKTFSLQPSSLELKVLGVQSNKLD